MNAAAPKGAAALFRRSVEFLNLPRNTVPVTEGLQIRGIAEEHDFLELSRIQMTETRDLFTGANAAPDRRSQTVVIVGARLLFLLKPGHDILLGLSFLITVGSHSRNLNRRAAALE